MALCVRHLLRGAPSPFTRRVRRSHRRHRREGRGKEDGEMFPLPCGTAALRGPLRPATSQAALPRPGHEAGLGRHAVMASVSSNRLPLRLHQRFTYKSPR